MQVRKQDIVWGYFAQFFSIASGIIILPMVLNKLSAGEIGMNYLMLSVAQFVSLVDYSFSPLFGRNITYIYSGVQHLLKSGIEKVEHSENSLINYRLLATLIQTASWIYQLMAVIVLLVLLTIGSFYIYHITNGFSDISNSLLIWVIYSIGVFFQIYYSYYSTLLTSSGKIMESKKVMLYSNIAKIVFTYLLLFYGYGLLGVVVANLLYPFLTRYLSYRYYFTADLKSKLMSYKVTNSEKISLFKILWYNTKKQGVTIVSSYLTYGVPMFLAGLYLTLDEVASYGLMIQFIGLFSGISGLMFTIYQPRFASHCVSGNIDLLRKEAAYTICIFNFLFIVGIILLILIVPWVLQFIGTQTTLPSTAIILACAFFCILDYNSLKLCQIVIVGNNFPFLKTYLYTGLGVVIASYLSLSVLHMKIWGIVLSVGIIQSLFYNWYCPYSILKQLKVNVFSFLKEGCEEIEARTINVLMHINGRL